jgi:hypothetical protein
MLTGGVVPVAANLCFGDQVRKAAGEGGFLFGEN